MVDGHVAKAPRSRPRRSRQLARRIALDGLSLYWHGTGRLEAGLTRPRVHFVYLHSLPSEHEARFDAWVEELVRTYVPLSYSAAVDRVLRGPIDQPFVALSLDDGFRSCARVGDLLARRGISACFFVPTGFVGTPTVDQARHFFGAAAGVDEPAMTWGDIEALKAAGHEVGSHTARHIDLSNASTTQINQEIGESLSVLQSRLGVCEHFAWPLGTFDHFSPAAAQAVTRVGLASCASAVRGAHTVSSTDRSSLCIRRDHVPAEWPHRHGRYFLARSSLRSSGSDNCWPTPWIGAM